MIQQGIVRLLGTSHVRKILSRHLPELNGDVLFTYLGSVLGVIAERSALSEFPGILRGMQELMHQCQLMRAVEATAIMK